MSVTIPTLDRLDPPTRQAFEFLLTQINRVNALLMLTDGVAAPTPEVGKAKVYIDVADGDLKVIFGDGTTKTIVTDT